MFFRRFSSLLALIAFTQIVNCYDFDTALAASKKLQPRTLKAAAREIDIARRGNEVHLKNEVLLHYIDPPSCHGEAPLGAHVSLHSSRLTLVLEEIDQLLEEVHCEDGFINLKARPSIFREVRDVLGSHSEILIITSHETCNERGSRLPYLASISDNTDSAEIKLSARPVKWRQAYSMTVDYGADHQEYRLNHHDSLRRRSTLDAGVLHNAAATTPIVSTPAVSSVSTVASSSQVVFPSATATPGPDQNTVTEVINSSFVDAQILPITGLNGFTVNGNSFPSNLALNCQNCTFTGNVQLTSGSFSTNSSNDMSKDIVDTVDDVVNFIENGYISVVANDLFAHVELSTAWPAGFSDQLDIGLVDIPLTPFAIPGIAAVGPQFTVELLLSARLGGTANLTYGFEVTVPDNSTAIASIGQVNASSITGFDSTNFTALPFGASIDNIALNLSATIRPQLLVGISFFDAAATAGAGVFLDLPTLALSVEQASGTDENCNPTTNQTVIQELSSQYAAMINVVPEVGFAAGVIVQAKANVPGLMTLGEQSAFTPLATTFAAPTACLAFDKSASVFVSPTLPPANAQSSGTGTGVGSPGSSSSSAAAGSAWRSQQVVDAAVLNAAVVGCLMLLGSLFVI